MGDVTGLPLSSFSNMISASSKIPNMPPYPSPTSASSSPIQLAKSRTTGQQLATPPLTPENDSAVPSPARHSTFQALLFPESISLVSQYSTPFQIKSSATWDGFVLALPGREKALYVDGKGAEQTSLRARSATTYYLLNLILNISFFSVVALLELADEQLDCSTLIIALPKSSPGLDDLIHSLMYVGGQVVTRPPFKTNPSMLLIGMEI